MDCLEARSLARSFAAHSRTAMSGKTFFKTGIDSFLHPFDFRIRLRLGDLTGAYQTGQVFFLEGETLLGHLFQVGFLFIGERRV